jgi:type II secretory pathway predicted ATPase ExeA
MYESFYGLRERPFDLTPNPRLLLLTSQHREALSNIEYGISARRGLTVLTGEAGTGKTTLVRAALARLTAGQAGLRPGPCAHLNNPTLDRAEFVETLARAFSLPPSAATSKARLLFELERVLLETYHAGGCAALIVDEAQSLPRELLEEIRLLANIETETVKLLPLVLIGQPELGDRLNQPELRQLKQRIALRCRLEPLDLQETGAYVAMRIRQSGGEPAGLFTRDAIVAIHQRARGIPRTINVIADNALLNGFALERRPIDVDVVDEVCRDFDLNEAPGALLGERAQDSRPPLDPTSPEEGAGPAAAGSRSFSLLRGWRSGQRAS